ncbi:MAG: hypothetical protein J6I64_01920 [Lachnospiraceae bacterium]|nr:hypothetical protein [Lachnospiraceae bacterium]
MYNGKYTERKSSGKRAAKRRRRRIRNTTLCFALILLLGMTIGGTIAYLVRESGSVENDFIPANVEISIDETFNGTVKSGVQIKNESNIPVYIRVALVGNWADADGKICINHTDNPLSSLALGDYWKKGTDGFYYYTKSVAVGGETTDLLGSDIAMTLADDGCSYQVEVIASAIQAQGDDDTDTAVYDAWGIDPASLQ